MLRKNRVNFSNASSVSVVAQTEDEALFLAQSLDYYRAVKQAGNDAPLGQFLNHAEAAVEEKGRELLRSSLENIVQTEIDKIEMTDESRLWTRKRITYTTISFHGMIFVPRRSGYEHNRTLDSPEVQ